MKYWSLRLTFVFISLLLLSSCNKHFQVAEVKHKNYRIEKASYPVDIKIAEIIEPYKSKLDGTMQEVIGYCDEELIKDKPSSTLTNWFADVLLEETQKVATEKIDFAIQNYGGIRIPTLAKGDVTVGKIFELMPFDNIMYIQKLPGAIVQLLMDKIAEDGGWPLSKTISMEISYGKAINIMIEGKTIDPTQVYNVAIPDYIANGGGGMDFLSGLETFDTGMLIRDMVLNNVRYHFSLGKHIEPNSETRIK